jgi:hypothetical protein
VAQLKKTAVIYDFDGTLARGNLQEQSFIPKINMERDQFWGAVKEMKEVEDADEILVYMHLMLAKAREANLEVTKAMLREHGNTPHCSTASGNSLGLHGSTRLRSNTACFWSTTSSLRV